MEGEYEYRPFILVKTPLLDENSEKEFKKSMEVIKWEIGWPIIYFTDHGIKHTTIEVIQKEVKENTSPEITFIDPEVYEKMLKKEAKEKEGKNGSINISEIKNSSNRSSTK